MKEEISATAILTIAITLLTMGIEFLEKNQMLPGIVCIIVGFGLILSSVLLIEYGVIKYFYQKIIPSIKR